MIPWCDGELKKRLFSSPSPEKTSNAEGRDEVERSKERSPSEGSQNQEEDPQNWL